jgi:TPR repeat protein
MKSFLALCLCFVTSDAQVSATYEELLAKAHAGDGNAAYSLGKLYEHPKSGKAPDFSGAAYWYTQATKQGVPGAMTDLAAFYLTGIGVPRDQSKAFQLFENAAKTEYPEAMTRLGEAMIATHYRGNGEYYGKPWIEKAANTGEPDALNDLGWLTMTGTGTGGPPQITTALSYFLKAAEHGSCVALINIGNLYLHGSYEFHFAQDAAEAQRWFAKVQACPGVTPELVQQALALAQRTARGELPALSRQEKIPSSTENADLKRIVAEVGVYAAVMGAMMLIFGNSSPKSPAQRDACERSIRNLPGGNPYAC